jgi:hypothetical protein
MLSPCGVPQVYNIFTIRNFKILGRMIADVCKIIVGLSKTYNDKIKVLKYHTKLLNDFYLYKNQNLSVSYVDLLVLFTHICKMPEV